MMITTDHAFMPNEDRVVVLRRNGAAYRVSWEQRT